MAVASASVLHGIINGSTFLSQLSNARVAPQIEQLVANPTGFPYPMFAGNLSQRPDAVFDSTQLKTILDLTGIGIADLSGANTDLLFKLTTNLGSRVADATASHSRLRAAMAGLLVNQISAGSSSEASANCRLIIPYNGTNEPIVPAGSLALSGTPASPDHWVIGPQVLNTVQLPGIQDVTIDFGHSLMENSGDGELYVTHVAIMETRPVITIRGINVPWSTYGLNGTALTAGAFYLRKVSTTGRVANGTSSHILFSGSAGLITIEETGGGGNTPVMTTVRVQLVSPNATTAPMLINTASAIT